MTTATTEAAKPKRRKRNSMQEAKASWNTIYLDKSGFECQLTLRDEDEESLAERVAATTARILESGGAPVIRRTRNGPSNGPGAGNGNGQLPKEEQQEKTYVDEKGTRRCNLKLKNGRRCNQPVTEKEGRYGLFWSCPDYKEHAPSPAR
jgi:hypothetical protein